MAEFNKKIQTTYNNVIDALKCVAISHGMVNSVSSGDVDTIDIAANDIYPLVHIVPTSATAGVNQITYIFNVIAMDLVKSDDSNEQQVLSDTIQIVVDIIAQYKNGLMLEVQQNTGMYSQVDDTDYALEPFTERFDNVVSGWNCNLSITVPYNYYACNNFNYSGVMEETGWTFTDKGTINCTEFKNVPLSKNRPDTFPPEVILPPE